jgi:hypothetical protein
VSTEIQESVIEKLKSLSPEQQRAVSGFVDELVQHGAQPLAPRRTARHIWEEIAEISAQLPAEDWRQVPSDGSEQHDHYLYGSPKREP